MPVAFDPAAAQKQNTSALSAPLREKQRFAPLRLCVNYIRPSAETIASPIAPIAPSP